MPSVPTATTNPLPIYLAPLPQRVEDLALRYAWIIVLTNLAGTTFGFWYYRFQLAQTPLVMWPFVPDSPATTLFVALSLAAWQPDFDVQWLHMLAFFGNIKLCLWTPFVQLFLNGPHEENRMIGRVVVENRNRVVETNGRTTFIEYGI